MEKLQDYVILMDHGLILIHQTVLLRFVKVTVYFLKQAVEKQLSLTVQKVIQGACHEHVKEMVRGKKVQIFHVVLIIVQLILGFLLQMQEIQIL